MAMDNMSVRKAQLEKLDEFVHNLYKETEMFKGYGIDLKDLQMMYLHIHDLIQDLLECDTTDEFMAKIAELHKAIAGVLIIAVPANAQQVVDELKGAHEAMSDVSVDDFLKNMQVKEKGTPPPAPKKTAEEREKDKDDLISTLDLQKEVEKSKPPKENKSPWGKSKAADEMTTTTEDKVDNTNEEPVDDAVKSTEEEKQSDPLATLYREWDKSN